MHGRINRNVILLIYFDLQPTFAVVECIHFELMNVIWTRRDFHRIFHADLNPKPQPLFVVSYMQGLRSTVELRAHMIRRMIKWQT